MTKTSVLTNREEITVITFRFFGYCSRILTYWNGTQLWSNIAKINTQDLFFFFQCVFSVHTCIIASTSHVDNDNFTEAFHGCINGNEH